MSMFCRFGNTRIIDIVVESEHSGEKRWSAVILLLSSPCEMCSGIPFGTFVSNIRKTVNALKFSRTRLKIQGSLHLMSKNDAYLTQDEIPFGSLWMSANRRFTSDSDSEEN